MQSHSPQSAFSRRGFLAVASGGAAAFALAACSSGGGNSAAGKPIKFWQMPMGNTEFNVLDKKIALAYKPTAGLGPVRYQTIQWNNFTQTFATAVASKTGPAVSSGGGTQVFQYAAKGDIAYADHLVESWKSNGLYDDFLPGLMEALKTADGHQAAIPQNVDMILVWYSPSLLSKAGVAAPTDWQSYLDAAAALKKIGVYGFGTGTGAANFQGAQTLVSWMINNGGGLFDDQGQPNAVTSANVEAVDFVIEMVKKGYVDPGATQYTTSNVAAQWQAGKFGLGFDVSTLPGRVTGNFDGTVGTPLKAPSGHTGTLGFINNIMMWKNTPSQKSSEAFLTYYYRHITPLWTKGTMGALPPLKSITETKEFRSNPNNRKIASVWQPIARTWAAPGKAMTAAVTTVDGTPAMSTFAQSVFGGNVDAKTALTRLQATLKSNAANL